MHWEAFIVIGLVTLSLGVLLFVPAWIWVKRKQRTAPGMHSKVKLTKLGWALVWSMVIILLGGLLMDYIAPESFLGRLVKMPLGRLIYLVIVGGIFLVLEAVLKANGIKLVEGDKP